jgi:hypothetical protein
LDQGVDTVFSRVGIGVIAALAATAACYAPGAGADNAPRAQIAPWGLEERASTSGEVRR